MDEIRIQDLEVFCHHGVYAEETKLGQKFLVCCTMYLNVRGAGRTDDLHQSVNYGTISHLIKQKMEEKTYFLIESVAEYIAEEILLFDEKIKAVDVEIKKPWAPIGLPLESVSVKISRRWHEVYIALGSNMGDKKEYIKQAVAGLAHTTGCRVKKMSQLMQTAPYGVTEQEEFLNGVLKLETLLTPQELLGRLHELEQDAGRQRVMRWGPRTLDLDILLYDDCVIQEEHLCVPHVDMQNREFVLAPMAEIAPYKRHPVYGKTIVEMLEQLPGKSNKR